MAARLYLVPNLLGVIEPADVLPAKTIAIARELRHFVVENAKPARQFLKTLGHPLPLREIAIEEIGERPSPERVAQLLAPLRDGHDIGVLSDAGCPAVADPGTLLVAAAHRRGLTVVPLVGPSAILLALMASGLNGQGFAFHGYLPVRPEARDERIRHLEAASRRDGAAQMFIETPYRNPALVEALTAVCAAHTRLCIAADLTTPGESIEMRTIAEWRGRDASRYARRPAMFILEAAR